MTAFPNGDLTAPVADTASIKEELFDNVSDSNASNPPPPRDASESYRGGSPDAEGEEDDFAIENGVK